MAKIRTMRRVDGAYVSDIRTEREALGKPPLSVPKIPKAPTAPPVRLRAMSVDDGAFIIDSWCSSYSKSPVARDIDPGIFKVEMRKVVYDLIPRCTVAIACNANDPKSILGWAAVQPATGTDLWVLHYILTRYEYQCQGIATRLIAPFRQNSPDGQMWGTFCTPPCRTFGRDWLIYNPFILINK